MTPGYDLKDHKTGQKYEFPRESKKQRENTPRWRGASKEQEIFQYVYNFNPLTTHLCSIWTFPWLGVSTCRQFFTWTWVLFSALMKILVTLVTTAQHLPLLFYSLLLTKTKNLTAFPFFFKFWKFFNCHERIQRKSFLKGSRWLLICTKFMAATMSVHSFIFLESEWTIKGWSAKASELVYLGSLYCRAKVETLK